MSLHQGVNRLGIFHHKGGGGGPISRELVLQGLSVLQLGAGCREGIKILEKKEKRKKEKMNE